MRVDVYRSKDDDPANRGYWSVTLRGRRLTLDFCRHEANNLGLGWWTRRTPYSFALHTGTHVTVVSWAKTPVYAP